MSTFDINNSPKETYQERTHFLICLQRNSSTGRSGEWSTRRQISKIWLLGELVANGERRASDDTEGLSVNWMNLLAEHWAEGSSC